MAMDGITLFAAMLDMQVLIGGKIDKVQQPERDELLLGVRAGGTNYKLLLSSSGAHARAQLTEGKRTNPPEAPMFCMLLRKRLVGGIICALEQQNLDRVLRITIEARNDLGDIVPFVLVCEVMGKHSNIILINEDNTIVDAIRHVGVGMSHVRYVLPGIAYELPPQQEKLNPLEAHEPAFLATLDGSGRIGKAISSAFFGFSPAVAEALASRVNGKTALELLNFEERSIIAREISAFCARLKKGEYESCLTLNEFDEPIGVYPFKPGGARLKDMANISAALDEYYVQHDIREHMQRHGAQARRVLQNNIERCEKKLALYSETLNSDERLEQNRLYGELLTANLHSIKHGASCAVVDNYYVDPPERMEIPLDPRYSPGDNAQRYYKKYQKLKVARDMATAQREEVLSELAYLEGQLENLGKCTTNLELMELSEELKEQGYIRTPRAQGRQKKTKQPESKPLCFISSDGIRIYVGKNNRQNDMLTLRMATSEDIWLHVKNIPGSHVIIQSGGEAPKATLFEAANLAVFYSKARGGENVPVDYTPRKFVKKPASSKPGMVIYATNKTAYITADEVLVKGLKAENT